MNVATTLLRWLYGLFYAWIGGSWIVHRLLGRPWAVPEKREAAQALVDALAASGFIDPMIATTSLVGGLLLLRRACAPLGIAVLAPLVVGIFLFHLLLTGGWVWGSLHLALLLVLAWLHRDAFRPLWTYRQPPR